MTDMPLNISPKSLIVRVRFFDRPEGIMKYGLLITTAFGLSLFAAAPAFADAETEALKKEVKALEARIEQLEAREKAQKKQTVTAEAPKAPAALDRRLAIVERNQEVAQETQKARDAVTPKFDYTPGRGMTLATPDKQYALKVQGYIQADNRTFFDSGAAGTTNIFLIRSARPVVEAKLTDYFDSRVQIDFGKGATTLLDAYGDFHPMPGSKLVNLRMGEFKVPLGIERWQSESDTLFVERGQTTNLVPYRDIGVMAYGQLIPDQLEYQVALVNGTADLLANTGDADNNKDVAGRIFVHPFTWMGVRPLEGLAFGVAGSYGVHQGSVAAPGLVAGYASFGQRTYFTYKAGVFANGPQMRVNPQMQYYYGPFGMFAEYVANTQEVRNGAATTKLRNNAWEAAGSYVLTGEDASFDGVNPAHDFDPRANRWGAFELAARVSELNVDHNAFAAALYADPAVSAREAFETTIGVNWYFSRAVKLNFDLSRTAFDGGFSAGRDHPDEKAMLTRAQFRF